MRHKALSCFKRDFKAMILFLDSQSLSELIKLLRKSNQLTIGKISTKKFIESLNLILKVNILRL